MHWWTYVSVTVIVFQQQLSQRIWPPLPSVLGLVSVARAGESSALPMAAKVRKAAFMFTMNRPVFSINKKKAMSWQENRNKALLGSIAKGKEKGEEERGDQTRYISTRSQFGNQGDRANQSHHHFPPSPTTTKMQPNHVDPGEGTHCYCMVWPILSRRGSDPRIVIECFGQA